jgi:gluconate 5-dehydrogenase
MLTRGMAVDWAEYNIQVNAIGPGYFKTEMTRALWENEAFDSWLRGRTPADRWGDPAELIGALLFFASAASDFVNGQIIYVDGGITAAI